MKEVFTIRDSVSQEIRLDLCSPDARWRARKGVAMRSAVLVVADADLDRKVARSGESLGGRRLAGDLAASACCRGSGVDLGEVAFVGCG